LYVVRTDSAPPFLVSAATLRRRGLFSEESIVSRVREGFPEASVAHADMLPDYDAYYYDRAREAPLPVVRVKFADPDSTWVYVDGMSRMVARFTWRERLERWIYHGLHSLDFPFWYFRRPLWDIGLVTLLGGGSMLSLAGAVIGFRRSRAILRSRL
jgi:hypothetical protein